MSQPSTPGQRLFAEELSNELRSLGLENASLDENCYLYASLPSNCPGETVPSFGLIAHLDTSADSPGANVRPRIHSHYNGKPIELSPGVVLDPAEFNSLKEYRGGTIFSSDGTTLLGADDKAGIAEIITALEFLLLHKEIGHGIIEVVFTPDEETGRGMNHFPKEKVKSSACITLDGSGDGVLEAECFEAYSVTVTVKGKSIHLGEARGKLVNAVEIAAAFVALMPKEESPQATDNAYGYYAPIEIKGSIEEAAIDILIRDFEDAECRRRIDCLVALGAALQKLHPGAMIEVKDRKQYANMKSFIARKKTKLMELLKEAVRKTGILPREKSIRGGTDGARLSEMGIPTPNLFTGGFNYHSRTEWAALDAMVRSAMTIVYFLELWKDNGVDE
jgi:tripeptide aminopeptidase